MSHTSCCCSATVDKVLVLERRLAAQQLANAQSCATISALLQENDRLADHNSNLRANIGIYARKLNELAVARCD